MSSVTEITDTTFASEVLSADRPVLVDYWADWCSPCKQLSPIIDELSAQFGDRMKFCKLDTNANVATPTHLGVQALPTIQIFERGALVASLQGGRTKGALIKAIQDALGE